MRCLICVSLLIVAANAHDTLQYYQELWNKSIEAADNWTRLLNNFEFRNTSNEDCKDYGRYDFVIIGGGTAGLVLANRLTENENITVIVLEIGGNETDFTRIPGALNPALCSDINWGYLTVPQTHACYGTINNQCDITNGKVLGGMTAIDMLYARGNADDFKSWPTGWTYEDVLPYFKKSEDATALGPNITNDGYRGTTGPRKITYSKPEPNYTQTIIDANVQSGSKWISDYNGVEQIGISRAQTTMYSGQRFTTNAAYLQPVLHRKNLKVLTHAFVTKINFKRKIATSVTFHYNNNGNNKQCKIVYAEKEVILTAGAINSPQLLMLSGIGPKNHLRDMGIKFHANLPVGRNLEDHLSIYNLAISTNQTIPDPTFDQDLSDYIKGEGLLSYPPVTVVGSYNTTNASKIPDTQVLYYYDTGTFHGFSYVMKRKNYNNIMVKAQGDVKLGFILHHIVLLHPKSRGTITLKSSDPTDYPNIDPNYLSHPDDIKTLYLEILRQAKLLQTDAFRAINATHLDIDIDACNNKTVHSERWYCIIRYKSLSMYHLTGTCRMGADVHTSVVDKDLKVHGFKNLRVVDASVIPAATSGQVTAVVIMMAEKIADTIKKTLT